MPRLAYGNGCHLHSDCFTCPEKDCVISKIVFPDDTLSRGVCTQKFTRPASLLEKVSSDITTCKYCGTKSLSKSGHYKGVKLYRCKDCGRKFRANGNYFHMKVSAAYVDMAAYLHNSEGYNLAEIRDYFRQEYNYAPSKSSISNWLKLQQNKNREVKLASVFQF